MDLAAFVGIAGNFQTGDFNDQQAHLAASAAESDVLAWVGWERMGENK